MAYWGGAGMNFVGGATKADREQFLATYDAWLEANGRTGRGPRKGEYFPKAYVPKPQRFYKTGARKGEPIVRKTLTAEQQEARLVNLAAARAAKSSGNIKPKKVRKPAMSVMQKLKNRNAKEEARKVARKAKKMASILALPNFI